jgi:hypothetical protein
MSIDSTPKREPLAPIGPQDRDSRARAIANTFDTAHIPLADLRHPTKQHLTATEAFDFLPDSELWPHEYEFVRFGEDPIDQKTVSTSHLLRLRKVSLIDELRTLTLSNSFETDGSESNWSRSSSPSCHLPRLDRSTVRTRTTRVLPPTGRPNRFEVHRKEVRRRSQWRRRESPRRFAPQALLARADLSLSDSRPSSSVGLEITKSLVHDLSLTNTLSRSIRERSNKMERLKLRCKRNLMRSRRGRRVRTTYRCRLRHC